MYHIKKNVLKDVYINLEPIFIFSEKWEVGIKILVYPIALLP